MGWTADDLKKKGRVEVDGKYVPVKSLVPKGRVEKLPPLNVQRVQGFKPNDEANPVENKKVRNATKSINDEGIKFDSAIERYMYERLKASKIDFQFKVEYLLQEKFRYNGEAVRAIKLTVDFFLPGYNKIIDTKGWANDVAPLKMKLLKWHLYRKDFSPTIELPATKKECDELINRLLYDKK